MLRFPNLRSKAVRQLIKRGDCAKFIPVTLRMHLRHALRRIREFHHFVHVELNERIDTHLVLVLTPDGAIANPKNPNLDGTKITPLAM